VTRLDRPCQGIDTLRHADGLSHALTAIVAMRDQRLSHRDGDRETYRPCKWERWHRFVALNLSLGRSVP